MTRIACTLRVLRAARKSPGNLLFYGKYASRVFEEVENELKPFTVYRGGAVGPAPTRQLPRVATLGLPI